MSERGIYKRRKELDEAIEGEIINLRKEILSNGCPDSNTLERKLFEVQRRTRLKVLKVLNYQFDSN